MGGILSLGFMAAEQLGRHKVTILAIFCWAVAIAVWALPNIPSATPIFHAGDVETMKLDGTKVMVVGDSCDINACRYWVRVPDSLTTVRVSEFEIVR